MGSGWGRGRAAWVGVVVVIVAFACFAVTVARVAVGARPVAFCVYRSDASARAVAFALGWILGGGPWAIVGEGFSGCAGNRGKGGLGRGWG